MAKEKKKPIIDYKQCMACCICISECPFSCLDAVKNNIDRYKKVYPELISLENCTGCGICKKACPIDAITMVTR